MLFGSSNDPKDQLGAILIENGKITAEQLDDVNTKVGPGNPLAKVLAESGYVNQRELGEAARIKVERILSDLVAYETGSFEFEDGVLPKGAVDLKLSTEKLLLAAVARITDRAFVLRHLESLGVVLAAAPDWDRSLGDPQRGGRPARAAGRAALVEGGGGPHPLRRVRGGQARVRPALPRPGQRDPTASAAAAADELDLSDAARGAFTPGGEDEARARPLPATDADAPFFTQRLGPSEDRRSSSPRSPPELPSIPYSPSRRARPSHRTRRRARPIEGLLAEPTSPTVVMPSIDAVARGRNGAARVRVSPPPRSRDFAMSAAPGAGFRGNGARPPRLDARPPSRRLPPPPSCLR